MPHLQLRKRCNHLRKRGVVAKSFAEVREVIDVARPEDEGTAQLQRIVELKRISVKSVLPMSSSSGPLARCPIVATKKMEDVGLLQAEGPVALEGVVDEQGKINATFGAEGTRILHTPEPDGESARPSRLDLRFMRAQLRDVLAAEDSAPMAQENDDRRLFRPETA